MSGVNPEQSADCTPFTGKDDFEGVPAPPTPPGLTQGRCAACGRAAEQAPSGRWWHHGEACEWRTRTIRSVWDVRPRAAFIPIGEPLPPLPSWAWMPTQVDQTGFPIELGFFQTVDDREVTV